MSLAITILGLVVLIILHEAGHFAAAKAVGMRVERFSLFFPPLLVRKTIGETEYAIGSLPFGGYVKISGMSPAEDLPDEVRTRAYTAQPVWKRIVVIAAGPAVNILIAFVLLLVFYTAIGTPHTTERVGQLEPSYPAASVLRPGDRLIAVDGQRGSPERLSNLISSHRCPQKPPTAGCRAARPATLLVGRDGRTFTAEVTPVYDPSRTRMRLGFGYAVAHRTLPIGQALGATAGQFWSLTKGTVTLPGKFFERRERKQISGIVGITAVASRTIADDLGAAVSIFALISLVLALVNLFPFLPLDGGHIFWALVEKVRRRPVPFSVMERASFVGIAVVLAVASIAISNDIGHLRHGGFGVR